ncbi:helix-turn-helix family protein [Burkholderia gladioli]|uniref:Helix-turn-helix family protein n=1 Tax=Burkholderia gladioli TaxID=28095 RepID=A0A095FJ10_BURGA|nr:helix-turn-helix transcriptional regulator [Burkholderia gladioli]AJW98860.1 helix-turn-helix family protein [Burkholderia gladioli]ASD80428.1 transcriptional regulator [Burkholderia gladioli pv. gladioli]AWY54333.1 transcriptional regulator [Burkholderia gladioli pv. gladioli]KGC17393.1 helix-turn-helix family protein [Burkholderia gladioli]PEH37389.1 XRE family transcriptional regulator [Burkholderia gladioli]
MAKTVTQATRAAAHAPTPFGERLAECRGRSKLSQQALADAASVSQTMISALECGRNQIDYFAIFSLADALGVDARWLATGEAPRPKIGDIVTASVSDPDNIAKGIYRLCSAFFEAAALFDVIHRAIADGEEEQVDLISLTALGREHANLAAQRAENLAKEVTRG